jgi:metal-responsive CopG/Arc/MetJ family transcriptional regulator
MEYNPPQKMAVPQSFSLTFAEIAKVSDMINVGLGNRSQIVRDAINEYYKNHMPGTEPTK